MRKMIWIGIFFFALLFPFFVFSASFNISLDDQEVYTTLEELEAIGAIDSQIYGIKPITENEFLRLLGEAKRKEHILPDYLKERVNFFWDFIKKSYQSRTSYIKPVSDPYFSYNYVDEKEPENILGRKLKKHNFALGFQSKLFISKHLLLHSKLEMAREIDQNDVTLGRLLMGYGKIGINKLSFEIGRDSICWGQSYSGTLLVSKNPKPFFPIFKLELEEPVLLPWIFKYLGLFKFSIFTTRLESDRYVPHPWFLGMKVSFKPAPFLEIGLNRTVMFGGEGRRKSLSTILFAKGENVNKPSKSEGDQKAGFDVRVRPIKHLVLYWEGAGEDEAGGLPSKWSHIAGMYLVGLFNKVNLRFEYSDITRRWYHHHVYRSGYTYDGKIIGYYTDRNCKTYFGELSYDANKNLRIFIRLWKEHYTALNEDTYKYELSFKDHFIVKDLPIEVDVGYRYTDPEEEKEDHFLYLKATLRM